MLMSSSETVVANDLCECVICMGECFEILNILVEVLRYRAQSRGPMGPSHQYFNTPKPFQTFSVTQGLLYVIFLPEMLSDSSRLILTI